MTPQELAEDLDKRLAAQQMLNLAAPGTFDVPTVVGQAIAEQEASRPTVTLGGAFRGAEVPLPDVKIPPGGGESPSAGATAPVNADVKPGTEAAPAGKASSVTPAPSVDVEENLFLNMLLRNDAVRARNRDAYERREKSDRARLTLASLSDALSSLANLAGTTHGAFSQQQTYQVPVVYQDIEKNRSLARTYAEKLNENEQSINLMKAKLDATGNTYEKQLALEQAKTDRAMALALAREDLARQQAGWKSDLEKDKSDYRKEEETQKQAGRVEIHRMDNEQKDINNRRTTGTSAANNIRTNDTRKEVGGGSVGGYTKTETKQVNRDDLGNVLSETKTTTRTPAGTHGSQATGGKKPNPMGSAPSGEKKKKKNPMN